MVHRGRTEKMQTTTIKSFCNTYVHHDEDNNAIGHTDPNPFSPQEYMHIDMNGNLVGYCKRNFGGGYMHYDADKNYLGRSEKNPFGGYAVSYTHLTLPTNSRV